MPNGKKLKLFLIVYFCCHAPLGGCGLKFKTALQSAENNWSPSTRRVWIEIIKWNNNSFLSLSPSTRRVWIEIKQPFRWLTYQQGHPPLGGCGLKF